MSVIQAQKYIISMNLPAQKGITVYMKPTCPYCQNTLNTLAALQRKYKFDVKTYDMSRDPKLFATLKIASGKTTVPQIFIGDVHIPGNDALMDYLDEHMNYIVHLYGGKK